ncbi:TPA_exp: putative G-patch domain protein [Trichophyton benhamiae CBS 112371]|uniref:G-patch domain protein, putative n=1 Tax=Arthroderma benhamiae (strain ATCC MYA-4681 / CBS 112371) TaxID=663331 RepID=D4B5Z0_ARTBC|nr:G-patch domain protein, putative [Trichophyton benhamiae CBS 112371]EFE29326.1 G-patch domain protein, putative [Trichophyton benhamiae CBS 112371]DAA72609.1 TPA_exp: putative G-patch domain protein [Trichophyton benhamiae CBS 112371]
MMASDDEEYSVPQAFGAGIKRKRVPFIPSQDAATLSTTSAPVTVSSSPAPGASSIADKYLSIVLPSSSQSDTVFPNRASTDTKLCEVCHLPLKGTPKRPKRDGEKDNQDSISESAVPVPHEASLAHQVCLPHSHPPSAIDRKGKGYKYLSSYGWDPDSRTGLGPTGSGIQIPLKPKIKNDTIGLGVGSWRDEIENAGGKRHERRLKQLREKEEAIRVKNAPKLNAKQIRLQEEAKRRQGEKLRDVFYRSEDVEKYLGS